MLYRESLQHLKNWFKQSPRKPLILRGARQVGKTTLVRMFCEQQGFALVEINLESDLEIRSTFQKMDPNSTIRDIELYKNIKFKKNTVLFIDEIQAVPEAIQGLRYFYEKSPELAVVCAGSLLEFTLSEHSFSMPVGRVEYLFIHPMKFSEFLHAKNEKLLLKSFQDFEFGKRISELYHERFLEAYYEYLIVGGMPEAVAEFSRSKNLKRVKAIHRTISLNYQNDFSKYAKRIPLSRLEKIFNYVPSHIGQKARYSQMDSEEQSKSLRLALVLLEKACVLQKIYQSDASGIPLKMGMNENIFKLLFLDVGLVSYDLKLEYQDILEIYKSNKTDLTLLHKGLISEQFVGQQLISSQGEEKLELYYWLREGKSQNAEVDYLIQKGLHIVPIEVKFGKTGSIRSLLQFVKERKPKFGIKFTTQAPRIDDQKYKDLNFILISLPVYLAERVFDLEIAPLVG
jgi:predicted AAA+ superfamily ATPase